MRGQIGEGENRNPGVWGLGSTGGSGKVVNLYLNLYDLSRMMGKASPESHRFAIQSTMTLTGLSSQTVSAFIESGCPVTRDEQRSIDRVRGTTDPVPTPTVAEVAPARGFMNATHLAEALGVRTHGARGADPIQMNRILRQLGFITRNRDGIVTPLERAAGLYELRHGTAVGGTQYQQILWKPEAIDVLRPLVQSFTRGYTI
jgi:hypothetical protein